MKKYDFLITGGTGFVGKHLEKFLKQKKKKFFTIDRKYGDLTRAKVWEDLPSAKTVIHAASKTFIPDSWLHPEKFVNANFLMTQNAIQFSKRSNARLIYISAYLYGNPLGNPINESHPINPNNPYAFSKSICEQLCFFSNRNLNTRICTLRPFNVYGPEQREEFLIPSLLKQFKRGDLIIVENLKPKRDFIFIDDLLNAILRASVASDGVFNNTFNIGFGKSHSVKDIIELIAKILGRKQIVQSKNTVRKNEIYDITADITKAKKILKWEPTVTLETGLSIMLKSQGLI